MSQRTSSPGSKRAKQNKSKVWVVGGTNEKGPGPQIKKGDENSKSRSWCSSFFGAVYDVCCLPS